MQRKTRAARCISAFFHSCDSPFFVFEWLFECNGGPRLTVAAFGQKVLKPAVSCHDMSTRMI